MFMSHNKAQILLKLFIRKKWKILKKNIITLSQKTTEIQTGDCPIMYYLLYYYCIHSKHYKIFSLKL